MYKKIKKVDKNNKNSIKNINMELYDYKFNNINFILQYFIINY